MLVKTRGIVFSYVKYKDTSIIVRVFTKELGLRSYLVNGVRKKNKGNKLIFYQPLSILELVVYENPQKDINRISEANFGYKFSSISFDVKKSAIALFLCEFLERVIQEQEENQQLYEFLENQLMVFDNLDSGYENFPIMLLLELSRWVGVGAANAQDITGVVNIPLDVITADQLEQILGGLLGQKEVLLSGKQRSEVLEVLIAYFHKYFGGLSNLKSLSVLGEVFN